MGVLGLKRFLEREKQTRTINIVDEINKWKKDHHGLSPSIAIDLQNVTISHSKLEYDTICGGRHKIALNTFEHFLQTLKSADISLVFFSALSIQKNKVDEWLSRRNQEFNTYSTLYYLINDGKSIDSIITGNKYLNSTIYGMEMIAKKYGELFYGVKFDCDLEIAHFAKNNDVIAIISNNLDFLLIDGTWRLWSSDDIRITSSNQLKTIEYEKNIENVCQLYKYQLPLFATLLGNDFTLKYYDELVDFHNSLGPLVYKIHCVARYVRRVCNAKLSDDDIKEIVEKIFGKDYNDKHQLIKTSIDSYTINIPPTIIDDPLEKSLMNTDMYRSYMATMSPVQGIILPFYDKRGCKKIANLSDMLADWLKRRIGVLKQQNKNTVDTFTLLAMNDFEEDFEASLENPIYPNFPVPSLDQLFFSEISEINWKIFGWITSLSDQILINIRKLPKEFLLISTTLFVLVQKALVDLEEADGILYVENIINRNEKIDVKYPTALESKCVRAAHLYNITYTQIRENFAIAGLMPLIQDSILHFDGVYYQKLMEEFPKMNPTERIAAIRNYRIYA